MTLQEIKEKCEARMRERGIDTEPYIQEYIRYLTAAYEAGKKESLVKMDLMELLKVGQERLVGYLEKCKEDKRYKP